MLLRHAGNILSLFSARFAIRFINDLMLKVIDHNLRDQKVRNCRDAQDAERRSALARRSRDEVATRAITHAIVRARR